MRVAFKLSSRMMRKNGAAVLWRLALLGKHHFIHPRPMTRLAAEDRHAARHMETHHFFVSVRVIT